MPREAFFTSADGLKLHARIFEPRSPSPALPVLCLPGLARTADDFDVLAVALSQDTGRARRVIAFDYRGRGQSGYDPDPAHYTPAVELADTLKIASELHATPAIFIGTSRGGILTMLAAALHPALVAGAILNDIGPVIEMSGLMRIKGYVGRLPRPASFDAAAAVLRREFGTQFPRLTYADWMASARRMFKEENGSLVTTYDPALAATLDGVAPGKPFPELWPQFDALRSVPVMVIRGALSDILSESTVAAMAARHPGMDVLTVPDEGHAPMLADPNTIAAVAAFVKRCDPS